MVVRTIFFTLLGLLAFSADQLAANTSAQQGQTLFRNIWSPYCKGVSLLECPSSKAEDLRADIRRRLAAGETEDDILADLKERYGDQLRMSPTLEGRESLAYWLPWIVFSLVVTGLWLFLMKKLKKSGEIASHKPATDPSQSETQRETPKGPVTHETQIMKDLDDR